jgi:hypothetical protein
MKLVTMIVSLLVGFIKKMRGIKVSNTDKNVTSSQANDIFLDTTKKAVYVKRIYQYFIANSVDPGPYYVPITKTITNDLGYVPLILCFSAYPRLAMPGFSSTPAGAQDDAGTWTFTNCDINQINLIYQQNPWFGFAGDEYKDNVYQFVILGIDVRDRFSSKGVGVSTSSVVEDSMKYGVKALSDTGEVLYDGQNKELQVVGIFSITTTGVQTSYTIPHTIGKPCLPKIVLKDNNGKYYPMHPSLDFFVNVDSNNIYLKRDATWGMYYSNINITEVIAVCFDEGVDL